jgi:cellulose synthase/poly-beta-1,6-N-acetylglucosamine synthase-like glycosyltransferase
METRLKTWESEIDSCLGANGAIYAIRPGLFWYEIPENTIVDDLVIGMKVREQGFRMLYDPDAVAAEELPQVSDEWVRRVRIGCGDYQAIGLCRKCLGFGFGRFALMFWSHKILRWITPHIMLVMFIISWGLSAFSLLYKNLCPIFLPAYAIAAGLAVFIIAGRVGRLLRQRGKSGAAAALCSVCDHFLTMNAALFAGFIRFCSGNASGAWKRTPRSE